MNVPFNFCRGAEGGALHRREVWLDGNITCGVGKQSRIVGGQQAKPEEFPWQVAFRRETNISRSNIFCGGSLIDKKWVVSAAHCFAKKPLQIEDLKVVLGEFDVWNEEGNESVVAVKNVILHPKYEDLSAQRLLANNDIALVELESEVSFNDYMKPVCLPTGNINFEAGKMCTVTGFGSVKEGELQAKTLRKANVEIVNNVRCARRYGPTVLNQTVCAGRARGGEDQCRGDSGGPLVCQMKETFFLTGVVKGSIGCGLPGTPAVYTKVSSYMDWIQNTTSTGQSLTVI